MPSCKSTSVLAAIVQGYGLLFSQPLRCCSCAVFPVNCTMLGLTGVFWLTAGSPELATSFAVLGVIIVTTSSFVVGWQRFVLSGCARTASVWYGGLGGREVKTAALLIAFFSPVISVVALGLDRGRPLLLLVSALTTLGLFSVLGLAFPAVAAGRRKWWRSLCAITWRWAIVFGITMILAGLSTLLLAIVVAFVASNRVLGTTALVLLLLGAPLAFFVFVVAPPAAVVALAYRHLDLIEIPEQTIPSAQARVSERPVLILAPDRELVARWLTWWIIVMIPCGVVLLWRIGGWWTALVCIPVGLQVSYGLLYHASALLENARVEIDDVTIRWVGAFDEYVVFLKDISEVQVRRTALGGLFLSLTFEDLERALAHDFYRRRGRPSGLVRMVLALYRSALHAVLHIDILGGLLKGLKAGSLPSGIGRRVDLYLEGDAAMFKDVCRFNFERCGVHLVLFPPPGPKSVALRCARDLDRRRNAARATIAVSPQPAVDGMDGRPMA